MSYKYLILTFLVLGLGLIIRIFNLGENSIWFDEAMTLLVAQENLTDIPHFITLSENHPPLYYLLIHLFMKISKSEFWLRLPSVISAFLTLILLLISGKKFGNFKTRILATLLLALNSLHIFYSMEIRNYTFGTFFITLTIISFYYLLEDSKFLFLFIISFVISLYTEYMTLVLFFIFNFWFFINLKLYKAKIKIWIILQVIVILLYLPWIFYISLKVTRVLSEGFWILPPNFKDLISVISIFSGGFYFIKGVTINSILGILAFILFIAIILRGIIFRKEEKNIFYLLAVFLIPSILLFLLSFINPIFHPRYLIWFMPSFLLLVTLGIRKINFAISLIILLLLNFNTLINYNRGELFEVTRKIDYRSGSSFIKNNYNPSDDIILHFEPFSNIPFRFYMGKNIKQYQFVPSLMNVPYYLGGTFIKEDEKVTDLKELLMSSKRIWVIGFVGKSYPANDLLKNNLFKINIKEHKKFNGLEIVLIERI